jgi:hypothetical protein
VNFIGALLASLLLHGDGCILDYTFYFLVAPTLLLAEYIYCCISLLCDYNKIFQTNMILICVTRMMVRVLYFSRKVLQCAELRDILFSWSIPFMCVSETFIQNVR